MKVVLQSIYTHQLSEGKSSLLNRDLDGYFYFNYLTTYLYLFFFYTPLDLGDLLFPLRRFYRLSDKNLWRLRSWVLKTFIFVICVAFLLRFKPFNVISSFLYILQKRNFVKLKIFCKRGKELSQKWLVLIKNS